MGQLTPRLIANNNTIGGFPHVPSEPKTILKLKYLFFIFRLDRISEGKGLESSAETSMLFSKFKLNWGGGRFSLMESIIPSFG